VHEAITLGLTLFVSGNLARQDLTKLSERVVERLVVDGRIEVLDENVTLT